MYHRIRIGNIIYRATNFYKGLDNMEGIFKIIIILFAVIGVLCSICVCVYLVTKLLVYNKRNKIQHRSNVCLKQVLDFKVQMRQEQTTNHELDPSSSYCEKIELGTIELNTYKVNKDTSICKNYRLG